jgi:hypothetical protein
MTYAVHEVDRDDVGRSPARPARSSTQPRRPVENDEHVDIVEGVDRLHRDEVRLADADPDDQQLPGADLPRPTWPAETDAVTAALGVATGEALHVTAVIGGLATLVTASRVLFAAIRYAGAAHLVILGIRVLRNPAPPDPGATPQRRPPLHGYRRSLVTNPLNPR